MKAQRLLTIAGVVFLALVLASIVLAADDAKETPLSRPNAALQEEDYGDAPTDRYRTLRSDDGARHLIDFETYLGEPPDSEPDGQPHPAALGDDLDGNDDEDGTLFVSPLMAGYVATVDVIASVQGWLNAWLDFNIDGDWEDPGEQIFAAEPLQPGSNRLTFDVPAEATPGFTFSRWRFSDQPDLDYFTPMEDQAPIGEVEDHLVEILGQGPVDTWEKWINGELWRPEISFTVETSDTIEVVELVRTDPATAFELIENWEPTELRLLDYAVDPQGFGEVVSQTGVLKWEVPSDHPEVMVLTKWFHVEPCIWAETVLEESLEGPEVPEPSRRVVFQKKGPILAIDAVYEREVFAGDPAQFTLIYSNTGGYENNVVIRNDFPPEAAFESSIPAPDRRDEESGLWAEWDLGDLPTGALDTIDVTVSIAPNLPLSTTVQVRDAILNHLREEADSVEIELHVAGTVGEPVFDLGDAPDSTNHAGVQMFTYAISPLPGVPANFPSVFDPATGLPQGPLHLKPLADAWLGPWVTLEYDADLMPDQDGVPNLDPPPGAADLDGADDGIELPLVLPDCTRTIFTYTVTITPGAPMRDRFVNVWFDWIRDGDWDDILTCAANGDAPEWAVQNQVLPPLPPGTYVFQTPAFLPYNKVPELPLWMRISIAEQPAPNPPDGSLPDGRGPANGYLYGETEDYYLPGVEPVLAEWAKWIDGVAWQPGITFTVETSQTIEVVDVITTAPEDPFQLTENWDHTKLRLRDYEVTPMDFSQVVTDDGTLVWDALPSHPEVITLTKWFHVEPSTWTETTLREILEGINVQEPSRTVIFEKLLPDLKLDALYQPEVYAGDVATFTLVYSNTGGAENNVAIRNQFPREALFLDSNPKPAWQAPDGSEVRWEIGYLGMGDADQIDVMVAISPSLPVSTQITIVDDIHNHLGEAVDRTTITYHVRGSPPQPDDRDIYIKDSPSDDGSVPSAPPWWISPDMWVRTDGNCANTTHQNPVAGTTNTICVRVRNRMTTTVSDITVNLYWGSAALGLYWPGSYSFAGSAHIASLAGGAQVVVAVPWNTPNITGHFCLLARADSPDDPVGSGPDTIIPQDDVPNNNNISMKNVNIVAYPELSCGSFTSTPDTDIVYLDVVNPTGHGATVDVELDSGDFSLGTSEIVVDPGALTWSSLNNLAVVGPDLIATGFPATIVGIDMGPYETVRISVTITAPLDERFVLHVSEWVDGEPVGGVDYVRMLPHCIFSPIILKNYSAPTTALGGMAAQIAPTWYGPAPGRRLRRTR